MTAFWEKSIYSKKLSFSTSPLSSLPNLLNYSCLLKNYLFTGQKEQRFDQLPALFASGARDVVPGGSFTFLFEINEII